MSRMSHRAQGRKYLKGGDNMTTNPRDVEQTDDSIDPVIEPAAAPAGSEQAEKDAKQAQKDAEQQRKDAEQQAKERAKQQGK